MARMTVKTLAAAVGVSPATISNAYNRPDQLSAELRDRILATAKELGYPGPDAAGRTLRMGRAEAVGVLLSERLSYAFSDPFAVEFLTGLSEVVEDGATGLMVAPGDANALAAALERYVRDRELRKAHGVAGRLRAERHFDIKESARAYADLVSSLGHAQHRAPGRCRPSGR